MFGRSGQVGRIREGAQIPLSRVVVVAVVVVAVISPCRCVALLLLLFGIRIGRDGKGREGNMRCMHAWTDEIERGSAFVD